MMSTISTTSQRLGVVAIMLTLIISMNAKWNEKQTGDLPGSSRDETNSTAVDTEVSSSHA